jgi:hypothetical protein
MPQHTSDAQVTDAQLSAAKSSDAQFDGGVVTAPWMGLHYRIEGP